MKKAGKKEKEKEQPVIEEDKEDLEKALIEKKKRKTIKYFADAGVESKNLTEFVASVWKPPMNHSFETMCLSDSKMNSRIRACGFRPNGNYRKIKNTCLLSKIKRRCIEKNKKPKLAVCVTMYNENEEELITTLNGVMYNYNELRNDKSLGF